MATSRSRTMTISSKAWRSRASCVEVLEELDGMDRFAARKRDRRDDGGGRPARTDRAAHAHGAAWRPRRRADRAVPDRPVVCQRRRTGQAGHRLACARAAPISCRRTGKRPISTGWRTSSPGASRASSGGVTRSRPGMGRTARSSSRRTRKRRLTPRSSITLPMKARGRPGSRSSSRTSRRAKS